MHKRNEGNLQDIQVSVVVPVYNAQPYLKKTLKDIQKQTLEKIEVICVDDGSEDGSADIIRDFAEKDKRFCLISQAHQDAGAARNAGLAKARGEYVIFWDADDCFEETALEKLYRKAEETHADICVCAASRFDEDGVLGETDAYLQMDLLPDKDPFNKQDIPEYIFSFTTNVPWNKLIRRSFLEKKEIQFQSIRQANDVYFAMMVLYEAERITYVRERLVLYRVYNKNSLTGKASEMNLCPYEAFCYTWDRMREKTDFALVKKSFQNRTLTAIYYILDIQTNYSAYEKVYNKIQGEGVALFGLDELQEKDVYIPWQYRDLQRLKTMRPEEFLHIKAFERRIDNEKIRQNANKLRNLLHKERTGGISYKAWRTLHALYRHTVKKGLDKIK